MTSFLQYLFVTFQRALRGFWANRCSIHAAGLTYFSILALVPAICLMILLARPLGLDNLAHARMNGALDQLIVLVESGDRVAGAVPFAALDEKTRQQRHEAVLAVTGQLRATAEEFFAFFRTLDFRSFGWIGLGMLLWTVVSTLGTIECSLNAVWGVVQDRPFWQRIVLYAFSSLLFLVLLTLAVSMPVLAVTVVASGVCVWLLGLFFLAIAFTLLFTLMPHTHVRFKPALLTGAWTSCVFVLWIKICTIAQIGILGASKLYGTFAILPIALAWCYVGWQIVLFGANLTYVLQTYPYQCTRCARA